MTPPYFLKEEPVQKRGAIQNEVGRTCNRCHTTWYTTPTPPIKQAKAAGWATPLIGKKRQTIRAEQAMVALLNQQAAQDQRCPGCGSTHYTEEQTG